MPSAYSFIDIAVLDAVRERFAAGDAVVILSADLGEVFWANGPGAALLGHADIEAAVGADSGLSFAARRQIMSTRGFPEIGRDRPIAVRLTQGMASRALMFSASAIRLPDDEAAIMLVVPAGTSDAGAAALGGFTQPGHHVAFLDRDGKVEAGSAGFDTLDIPPSIFAELVAEVAGEQGRLVKKIIRPGDRRLPAGIARLRDHPARHLLVIVDEAQFAEAESVSSAQHGTAIQEAAEVDATAVEQHHPAADEPRAAEAAPPEQDLLSATPEVAAAVPADAPSHGDEAAFDADPDRTPIEAVFAPAAAPDDADLPDAVQAEAVAVDFPAETAAVEPGTVEEPAPETVTLVMADDAQAEAVGSPAEADVAQVEAETQLEAEGGQAETAGEQIAEPVADAPAEAETPPPEPVDLAGGAADEPAAAPPPAIDRNAAPVRFVWKTDAESRFSAVSPEFLAAVGADAGTIVGQPFAQVSAALGLDPDGDIAGLLARRDTWSGRSVLWPLAGTDRKVPVDLAALPIYSRDRRFEGFRGFGVARLADMVEMPPAARLPEVEHPTETTLDAPAIEPASPPEAMDEPPRGIVAEPASTDPFQGEVPALTIAPKPDRRTSDKIIRLAEHRPPQPERFLSSSERTTFREIGERLRKEGGIDDDAAIATASDTGHADAMADTVAPVIADAPLFLEQATNTTEETTLPPTTVDDTALAAVSTDVQAGSGVAGNVAGEAADTLEPLTPGSMATAEAAPPALVADHAEAGHVEAPALPPADTIVVEGAGKADHPHLSGATPAEPSTSTAEPHPADDHGGHAGTLSFADADASAAPGEAGDAGHPTAMQPADAVEPGAIAYEPDARSTPTPSSPPGSPPLPRSTGERNAASAIGASSPPSNGGEVDRAKPETEWGSTAVSNNLAPESEAVTTTEATSAPGDALPASDAATWQSPAGPETGHDTLSPTSHDIAAPTLVTDASAGASEPPVTEAPAVSDAAATTAPEAVPAQGDTGSDQDTPGEVEPQPAAADQSVPPPEETVAHPQGEPPFESADIAATVVPLSPVAAARAAIAGLKTNGFVPSAFSAPAESVKSGQDTPILARLPVPLLIHSGDVLHYANDAFLTLTGYESLVDLADAGGLDSLFPEAYDDAGSEEVGHALRLRTVDGQEFPVEALLRSVPWNGGRALMLVVRRAGDDLHEELGDPQAGDGPDPDALKARIAEMRAIIDTATDGVILITRDGAIRSISRPAEALFGYESDEIAGRPFVSLFAIESQRAARDYLNGLTDHGVASVLNDGREVIGRESQGRFIPLFMTIGKLPNDTGYCAVVRDITPWKRAEEELTQARTLAERASSQKSDFLARISHEIRTPLNAIIGFSELMIDERFGSIGNDRYRDYLQDINRSGNHVLELVNDLLDISKIEAGEQEMAHEAVSLNETLAQTVAMMQPQANRERVIIRSSFASRLPDVVADSRSVRQIALNLLSNAVRYTQAGGQVIVSTAYELSGDVVMRVRDTGIGMSSAEIEQALKPFKQINALKRPRGEGTGLGLPLTKAMVEANRARFTINSTPGEGTLVEVTFPSTRVLAN